MMKKDYRSSLDIVKQSEGFKQMIQAKQKAEARYMLERKIAELERQVVKFVKSRNALEKIANSNDPGLTLTKILPQGTVDLLRELDHIYEELGYEDVNLLYHVEKIIGLKFTMEKEQKAQAEKRAKQKAPIYRLYEHSEEELMRTVARLELEAKAMGRMPESHKDVPEIKGWLLPYLYAYDSLFNGRWDYWGEIINKGTIDGSGPIPQIEWAKDKNQIHQVSKMIQDCLNLVIPYGSTISEFADWLLWGLGRADEPARIPDSVNEHWYKTFDLALVLKYPTDYMSGILEEVASKGHKQALGYFATPIDVTNLMHDLVFSGQDPEVMKTQTVYEPCAGCGAMLLPASNKTLFAAAQDINPVAVKLCEVQMMWYAPWYAINPFNENKRTLNPKVKEQLERLR
jgi:intracellular sulfur oxidation DsrE/DsrF family protein